MRIHCAAFCQSVNLISIDGFTSLIARHGRSASPVCLKPSFSKTRPDAALSAKCPEVMPLRLRNGRIIQFPMRQTAIWQRRAGRWVMVHEHVSAPIGAGTPQVVE
jgi:hypothetical protein